MSAFDTKRHLKDSGTFENIQQELNSNTIRLWSQNAHLEKKETQPPVSRGNWKQNLYAFPRHWAGKEAQLLLPLEGSGVPPVPDLE